MGLQEHTFDDQTMQQWYTIKQVITITVVFVTDNKYEEDDWNNAGRVKAALLLSVLALLSGNDLCKINDSMGKYAKEDNSTELNVTQAHRWGLVLRVLLGQDAAHHSMVHLSKGEHKSLTCHMSNPLCCVQCWKLK